MLATAGGHHLLELEHGGRLRSSTALSLIAWQEHTHCIIVICKQADEMRMNRLLQMTPPDAYGICCGAPGAKVKEAALVTDLRG